MTFVRNRQKKIGKRKRYYYRMRKRKHKDLLVEGGKQTDLLRLRNTSKKKKSKNPVARSKQNLISCLLQS